MTIRIDGLFVQAYLHSEQAYSAQEMEGMYNNVRREIRHTEEVPKRLCDRYNMTLFQKTKGLSVDVVIDTDTDLVYELKY